ncbi:unnamed protein product [Camellia sinensis]
MSSSSPPMALNRLWIGLRRRLMRWLNAVTTIAKALNSCNATTGDIIYTTERINRSLKLLHKDRRLSRVSIVIISFLINALREEDMNDNFFKALSHVQEIHANCKVSLQTHHQFGAHGYDGHLPRRSLSAFAGGFRQSVGHWVTMIILKSGAFENSSSLPQRKASPFQVLCRRDITHYFRRFITALTRGGPGGLPRPIEVHAHDPLHYVGDTLGWLHQAFASERELVLVLLDPDVVVDTGPTAHRFSKGLESDLGKIETDFSFALDRIFEGVCQPFKVRVKQVLQSQPNIMISYKVSNTLEFYSQPYYLLGRETALSNTLWALKDAAQKTFFDILKTRDSRGEAFTISSPCLLLLIFPHHLQ